ncbi:mucin-binding protein, partial [Limosilactobacillus equigenerosi]
IVNDTQVPASQTIKYVGAGDKTPSENKQTFTFNGHHNEATNQTTWDEANHTFGKVQTPVIDGYYADVEEAGGVTVTPDDPNKVITVTYKPVGKIVPKDPDGHEIPGNPGVPYTNDPNDPTGVTPDEPVPTIPGYTPNKTTVTPNNPGEDTPVTYTPINNDEKPVANHHGDVPTSKPTKAMDTLPQTGSENDNALSILGLSAMSLMAMVGLKRKKRD